jgi:hypothetical protein
MNSALAHMGRLSAKRTVSRLNCASTDWGTA